MQRVHQGEQAEDDRADGGEGELGDAAGLERSRMHQHVVEVDQPADRVRSFEEEGAGRRASGETQHTFSYRCLKH